MKMMKKEGFRKLNVYPIVCFAAASECWYKQKTN